MTYENLIKKAEESQNYWKAKIIRALKEYIEANHDLRMRPESWSSAAKNWGPEYKAISERYRLAISRLWEVTDIEYDEDGFREHIWWWRYWKVMARKCCWYQKKEDGTNSAAMTMTSLGVAEENFVKSCGLTELYQSPGKYIERMFPNLKNEKSESKSNNSGN